MIFHSIAKTGEGRGRRGWVGAVYALLASCALHLLVFWPGSPPAPSRLSMQNLAATLRSTSVAPPAPKPAMPVTRSVRMAAPGDASPALNQVAVAPPSPSPSPALGDATTTPNRRDSEQRLAGVDGDAMRGYRMALGRSALQHLRYPPLAQQQGWTGRAEVRVVIPKSGAADSLANIVLARSSGHDELDRLAVETLRRAVASTPMPSALAGRELVFDLPVIFEAVTD